MAKPSNAVFYVLLWLAVFVLVSPITFAAGSAGGILESLMRAGRKGKHAASEGKILKHVDDLPIPNISKHGDVELLRRFERLEHVDDDLKRQFRELPLGKRALVVELGEASQQILRKHQNAEEIIRKLDADGLMQARTYGDFVIDGVQLMGPEYKDVVRKTGSGASLFYTTYLKPHYKELAAAGLVSAYLIAERFHDAAGRLTEHAVRDLTRLGIEVAGAAHRRVWEGVRSKLIEAPVSSTFGIGFIIFCLALALPRVRWHILRGIRPLFTTPACDAPPTKQPSIPAGRFKE